jgi:enoyl-CoA hydratase
MQFNNLLWNIEENILTLTVNRESKLNALNFETIDELRKAFEEVYKNADIKAVILTGAGAKSFVAGADITELAHLNKGSAFVSISKGQSLFSMIEKCPKPVIAAVNGFALGGGCELAMACHIRVASENARFGQPEVNLGLIPGYGGTQRLPLYIGKSRAFELLMTGDMIDANTALNFGLVNYVIPQADLLNKCREILRKVSSKAPIAISQVIKCVNAFYQNENGYLIELDAFGDCCQTDDFQEGTAAFMEKRKPAFAGN